MPQNGAPSEKIVGQTHNRCANASLLRALKGALKELSGFQHCASVSYMEILFLAQMGWRVCVVGYVGELPLFFCLSVGGCTWLVSLLGFVGGCCWYL